MKRLSIALVLAGLLGIVGVGRGDEPKSKAKGTLTLGGTTYKLASVLAYEQTVFKKKETVVILSEKPLDTAKLMQSLKKNGNDDDFFPVDAHVKLALDGKGELLQLSVYAAGANIIRSGDRNIQTKVTFQEGMAKGTAGTKKADTFRDKPFEFEVTFDAAVIPLPGSDAKPPVEPKTKVKTTPGEPSQPKPVTEKELRVEGKLTKDSPKVMGKPSRIHEVKLSPDKTYIIDMESTDFDAYLRILDSDNKQLAEDDDSGGNLNARIRFTPRKEGNYRIVATSFGSGEGNYLLKIRGEPNQPQPADDKEQRIEGKLAKDSPKVKGKPAVIHRFRMSADKTYIIDLESTDFDPYLRILDASGKQLAEDDDSGGNLNARIRFTPPKDGDYQIVATRFGARQGSYLLKIRAVRAGEEK